MSSEITPRPIFELTADAAMTLSACGPDFQAHFGCDVSGQGLSGLISNRDRKGQRAWTEATTRYEEGLIDLTLALDLGAPRFCRVRAWRDEERWHLYLEDLLREPDDAFLALTESAQRWAAVIGQSDDGIAILDAEHRIVEFNERFLTLGAFTSAHGVALNEESITARSLFDLIKDNEVMDEMQAQVELSRKKKRKRFRGVIERAERQVEITTSAIHLPVQGFVGTCVIFKDVTTQKMLEITSRELQAKNADIQAMLQNLKQGIFTIVEGFVIHAEYSRHLEVVLGVEGLAGREALPLLLDEALITEEQKSLINATVLTTVGCDSLMFMLNEHLLPRQMRRRAGPDGPVKDLELDWVPLEDAEGVIRRLLVTVRDVTELRQLEAEQRKQSEELALIAELVPLPGSEFADFERISSGLLNQVAQAMTPDRPTPEIVEQIFRDYHTLKGNSRFRGLTAMSTTAHDAETRLAGLREDPEAPWEGEALMADLEALQTLLARYAEVNNEVLGRRATPASRPSGVVLSHDEVFALIEDAQAVTGDPERSQRLVHTLKSCAALSLQDILQGALKGLTEVAQHLDKPVPEVRFEGAEPGYDSALKGPVGDLFIHLLTNALDHGIDAPADREARGLAEQGQIRVQTEMKGNLGVRLVIQDDGPGLDTDALRARLERPEADDDEILEAIFRSGVSSREAVTLTSGRGVGMDAARQMAEGMGGRLTAEFVGEAQGAARRPIRFVLWLPRKAIWRGAGAEIAA